MVFSINDPPTVIACMRERILDSTQNGQLDNYWNDQPSDTETEIEDCPQESCEPEIDVGSAEATTPSNSQHESLFNFIPFADPKNLAATEARSPKSETIIE